VNKQLFGETYYVVRYQENDLSEIQEKTFRSFKKAQSFNNEKCGKGYRSWIEEKVI
jgi:hypothetical protein